MPGPRGSRAEPLLPTTLPNHADDKAPTTRRPRCDHAPTTVPTRRAASPAAATRRTVPKVTDPRDAARIEAAIDLARRLLAEADSGITGGERRRQRRLARLIEDAEGRELVQALTDEVLRIERPRRAANRFARIVADHGVPRSLGLIDRGLMALGARVAPGLPPLVMPLATRRIVAETHGLVIPAEDPALATHIASRRAAGVNLNINVLGEAILSDEEADQRLVRVTETMARRDVDYVSVKISALCAQLDVLAFEHSVDRICERLEAIFRVALAARPPVFVNLDMEEYADLHLTVEAFTRVLAQEDFRAAPAGIVLQAYLPDSHDVLAHLAHWSAQRVAAGGAPIKIRIVKGANLAMERVDAEQHGWVQAPYALKSEVDASYKRLLDAALPHVADGTLRLGVASHNLFDIAWALTLVGELPPARRAGVDIEMLEGMVPAQARAVLAEAGRLLFYCPIVRHDEIEASLAYLARRFDENTGRDNFLRAMFTMEPGSPTFDEQADRFRAAVADRHTVSATARRPAVAPTPDDGFHNAPDSDFTAASVRVAVAAAMVAPPHVEVEILKTTDQVDAVVAQVVAGREAWAATAPTERAGLLNAAADRMEADRFATLALMADEAGKTAREGDPEVSEAIDFARYYATAHLPDGTDPIGTVLVASPWNFPYAIPGGGVFAALMAGNTVVLKPAPETRRIAKWLVDQCHAAGIPQSALQYLACPDDDTGRHLITHDAFATVILTGSYDSARLFLGWKPGMRLLAETSGKNAVVVTEAADQDAAIKDIVKSAFGHAGQKCSAASLAIVEAPVYDDPSFLARLAAAVRTVRVGWGPEPATIMGPLIAPPTGNLHRALTTLEPGERWLVEPRQLDDTGRLWSPGVRADVVPGSWFHQTECFGPVLGVIRADDLGHAIAIQNDTAYGLTAGLHSLDPGEIETWLGAVQAGNLYVNRHITGAIVRRQPFGGWKRSSIGGAPKAGGPDYVAAFRWPRGGAVDAAAAGSAYRQAWGERFGVESDPSGLVSEANLHRYRSLGSVAVVVGPDTPAGALEAAHAAATVCRVHRILTHGPGLDEAALIDALSADPPDRVRILTGVSEAVLAACHGLDVAVLTQPVSPDPLAELPLWLHEQALSISRHRYGRVAGVEI
jgi:RHH-type proline utilization regulon transcriptional repressor/proline dehydrogenase/delta 1-pyrroline-5-carboxylate dehydrogenase